MSSKLLQGFLLGPWKIEPLRGGVSGPNGENYHLEPKVMDVFVCLAERANELVTRNQLLDIVWSESTGSDEQLTRAIGELRRVLHDDPSDPTYIETVPKRGYRLIAEVRLLDDIKLKKNVGRFQSITQHSGHKTALIISAVLITLLTTLLVLNAGNLRNRLLGGAAPVPITSIAVLPLNNLSGDPAQEYFTDGMTEALTAELGQINALKVISRTSAMQYKATDKLMPEIATELGVDALLEGSVLRAGNEVRITLQLVHGPTDRHLWSMSFQRDLRDILALQGEVARAIADEIQITLTPSLRDKLQPAVGLVEAGGPRPQAYDAYLKGRYHFNRSGEEAFRKAIRFYEEAIVLDPTFALAHAALAEVCLLPPILINEVRSLDDCEDAALRAVELDEQLAEAHAALGLVKTMRWDWAGSEAEFKRAINLNPNSVMARQLYSAGLRPLLRSDEALREIRRAEELDPLNLFIKTMVGWPLMDQRRFDEALAQWDEVLEMDPEYGLALYNQGLVYSLMAMSEEVLTAAQRTASSMGEGGLDQRFLMAAGYALGDDKDKALEVLAKFEQDFGKFDTAGIASVYLMLGKEEEALTWLEKGYEMRSPDLPNATSEPFFDGLRDHPRFQALRRKMGLP